MKFTPTPEVFEKKVLSAFETALDAAVDDSRGRAPKVTGKYAASIQHTAPASDSHGLSAAIGATVSSARAKELGAYITPKRAPRLVFNAGQGVRQADAVRLPARPVVGKTVRRWPQIMTTALRGVLTR